MCTITHQILITGTLVRIFLKLVQKEFVVVSNQLETWLSNVNTIDVRHWTFGEHSFSSEVDRFLDGLQAAPLIRQVERLEYVGEGSVMAAHPLNRGLQVQEAVLLQNK